MPEAAGRLSSCFTCSYERGYLGFSKGASKGVCKELNSKLSVKGPGGSCTKTMDLPTICISRVQAGSGLEALAWRLLREVWAEDLVNQYAATIYIYSIYILIEHSVIH